MSSRYWELMERDVLRFQQRIRSAIREEMIHALQIVAVRRKYYQCKWPSASYHNAQSFYEHLLGAIIDELATRTEGQQAVLIAAQLYYEDWSITSMERLEGDRQKIAR